MIRGILFDMDGVLIDSFQQWFLVFNEVCKKIGRECISEMEFREKVWARDFRKVKQEYFLSGKFTDAHFLNANEALIKSLKRDPALEKTLAGLKSKYALAVATNTRTETAERMLLACGIRQYFSQVLGGDLVKNAKPAPDLLLRGLQNLGLGAKDALYVGDTVYDREAAQNAGLRFVGCGIDGDARIEHLSELANVCVRF